MIGSKYVFKKKEWIEGVKPNRHKARWVVQGYSQKESIDYNEVIYPVPKYTLDKSSNGHCDTILFTPRKDGCEDSFPS